MTKKKRIVFHEKKHGTIEVLKTISDGLKEPNMGSLVGWFYSCNYGKNASRNKSKKFPIFCAGPVRVGVGDQFLCIVAFNPYFCWLRNGRLWWHENVKMPYPFESPQGLADPAQTLDWADACTRGVLDRITPNRVGKIYQSSVRRYWGIVRVLVDERLLDAASLGYDKTYESFARSVCEDWRASDMLSPRCPTIKHAVLVSLVLALEAEKAAQLIEFAGLMEHKVPIISQEAGLIIYQHAASILARLCPQWWNRGYLCEWKVVGSIERIFRAQHVRMLNDAFDKGVQFESSAGVLMENLLSDIQLTGPEADMFRDDDCEEREEEA